MSKFTPGPWKNDGKKLITTVGIAISKDKSLGPIAVVSEENAPIILASPEMYETIKEIRSYITASCPDAYGVKTVIGKLDALIAKIEGETP